MRLFDEHGVTHGEITSLPSFGIDVLPFEDPDGVQLELTAPVAPARVQVACVRIARSPVANAAEGTASRYARAKPSCQRELLAHRPADLRPRPAGTSATTRPPSRRRVIRAPAALAAGRRLIAASACGQDTSNSVAQREVQAVSSAAHRSRAHRPRSSFGGREDAAVLRDDMLGEPPQGRSRPARQPTSAAASPVTSAQRPHAPARTRRPRRPGGVPRSGHRSGHAGPGCR